MAEPLGALVRILLLEDSAIDAELLSGHLAKDKQVFTIERTVSRESFRTALLRGGFDVILSDFSLPDFDGLAALELAKAHAPDVPFIFVSGLMGEEFATSALRRGATDYILKRNLSRISTAVDRALADVYQRAERRKAEAALLELNATLEIRVAERTRQLQESEARLRTIFQTSNQYQGFMTPEGVLLDTNELSLEGIGVSLEEVTGKNYWDTPWFTDTPRMSETIEAAVKAVAAGEVFHREVQLNLPVLGARWFELTIRPIYDKFGEIIALVPEAVDFTQRRAVEEALRQSQKMEALGQLTGGIAHDFNNLLTGITGALDLIKRRLAAGRTDGIDRIMEAAFSSSQRAAALTHRLLAFARRQSLHTKAEDANALILGLADILRRTLGENTAFEIALQEDLWLALTDGNQLENALLNLAINARDAMPDGGTLKISTRNAVVSVAEARAGQDMQPGEFIAVSVGDSGTGIEPGLLDKVFEPFFTTKPIGQGTGLGALDDLRFCQAVRRVCEDQKQAGFRYLRGNLPSECEASAKRANGGGCGGAGFRKRRDGVAGGRRQHGAVAGVRGSDRAWVPVYREGRCRQRDTGSGVGAADRPADYRCRAAGDERAATGGDRPAAPEGAEGIVHHRLCGERGDALGISGARHGSDDKALHLRRAEPEDPATYRGGAGSLTAPSGARASGHEAMM